MTEEPLFGEAVRVNGRLSRSWLHGPRKEWVNLPGLPPRVALVIGKRTLSNGSVRYMGDDGTDYRPDKHFKAFLVVEGIKSKPYYVLPENVLPLVAA